MAPERLLLDMIVKTRGTVEVSVDLDVDWGVLDRITNNGAEKRFPGSVVNTDGSVSEGVRIILSRR